MEKAVSIILTLFHIILGRLWFSGEEELLQPHDKCLDGTLKQKWLPLLCQCHVNVYERD